MRRRHGYGLLALLAAGALAAGCGGGGGSGDAKATSKDRDAGSKGHATTKDATSTGDDGADTTPAPAPSPGPVPDADGTVPVVIVTPTPFTSVVRSAGVVLTGTAKVPKPQLAWAILGSDLKPLAQGTMRASCTARCVGHYRVRLATGRVPVGSWELHVWQPDPAGGSERLHDTLVPITVVERATPGAPPADAFPPGGAPQP
ncbi:MAG: hypothetical protein JWM98_2446 [Thermoleophilia bacterium]|nr:hypothetical protein [Thermoleophilia bacterium]